MKASVTNFINKFTHNTDDIHDHVMSLTVEDIRAIATLNHHDVDLSEEAILYKIIKLA